MKLTSLSVPECVDGLTAALAVQVKEEMGGS